MASVESQIAANYTAVRGRIAEACRRSARHPSEVRLVAVTKSAEIGWIETLLTIGVRDLAESRPQSLCERAGLLDPSVRWHLVGHLQRNKIRKVLPLVSCIHSVDTLPLLRRLDEVAGEIGQRPRLLLEVNISGENQKNGFNPSALVDAWPAMAALSHVTIAGLMTMAPWSESPEAARPVFSGLRTVRNQLAAILPTIALPELSMGMSGDFEVAVEEGATLVRIGTSLFEGLNGSADAPC